VDTISHRDLGFSDHPAMTATPSPNRVDMSAVLNPPSKARWRRPGIWLLALLAVVGLVFVSGSWRSKAAADVPQYVTERVTRGALNVKVSATGTLQPTNEVEVGSELSGLIEAVFVDDNDTVKKGQELARLDTSRLRDQITKSEAALASAEARLAQSAATVKEATATLDRLREVSRLSGGRVPSKSEMETAEATLARADADRSSTAAAVTEARAVLSSDRTNLSKASIRSPINGVVLQRNVEPGQTVAASLQVATLFTIAEDLRQMELEVNVDEADVGRVRAGQQATFTVDAYPDRKFTAAVSRVAYGSTKTGDVVSYTAVLKVSNDDVSLRPGMTASAEIASASVENALLVPNAALRFTPPTTTSDRGGFSILPRPPQSNSKPTEATAADAPSQVWVLRNGSPVVVTVTTGETDGRHTSVKSEQLSEGTPVITDLGGAQE
jgi:HlyD family secretion protein